MGKAKRIAAGVCLALALLVGGCMLLPGRFTSDLALRGDGTFTFSYRGEIVMPALGALGRNANAGSPSPSPSPSIPAPAPDQVEVFVAETCHAATGEERSCSRAEMAEQRARWAARQPGRTSDKSDGAGSEGARNDGGAQLQALLGGVDPADPRTAREFAAHLLRQQGWKSVIDKGNGRFEVVYEVTSRLTHDFVFPAVEGVPTVPFVALYRRADGTVRIDAPAFVGSSRAFPLGGLAAAAQGANKGARQADGAPDLPVVDGTFALVTNAPILANNTDEGPQSDPAGGGQRLVWKVDARTMSAPTALVRLGH